MREGERENRVMLRTCDAQRSLVRERDKIILLSGLRPITTGINIQAIRILIGSSNRLKLSYLVFKALKTKMDNFCMVGASVLANNKENVNMDGCLWYFGGISSSLKAVYVGHTNKNLVKKVNSRMYCMRKLRSSGVKSDKLVTFYDAVICRIIMFGSVCWGESISKLDRGRLEKIVTNKSRSCCGKATGQF